MPALHRILPHWFVKASLLVVAGDVAAIRLWPETSELGVILDVTLLVPLLYLLCYRPGPRAGALRVVALACLGIWLASHLVPADAQQLPPWLEPLRWAGLGLLILVEIKVVWLMIRAVLGRGDAGQSVDAMAQAEGLPRWAARLMAWEARLWQALVGWFRR